MVDDKGGGARTELGRLTFRETEKEVSAKWEENQEIGVPFCWEAGSDNPDKDG